MDGFGFKFNAKNLFFDRKRVIDAFGAKGQAAMKKLSRIGAFVRQTARTSMRPGGKKGKTSPPGTPPRTHVGTLKKLLYFAYDQSAHSVVIGPQLFKKGGVPGLLEFGGSVRRKVGKGRFKTLRYRGNPYMAPALQKEIAKGTMPKVWAASVKG